MVIPFLDMNLFEKLSSNSEFLQYFCDVLESLVKIRKGYIVSVEYRLSSSSIFFFIDGSSILQIIPDKELQYTYAGAPSYQNEIQIAIQSVKKQYTRDFKIYQIIKKES